MNNKEVVKQIKGLIKIKENLLEGDELDATFEYDIEVLRNALKVIKENPKGVWVATMDSESYEWKAVGLTEDEAIDAIAKEWNKSPRRDSMTREELEDFYGIECEFMEYGKCEWR
jgi:hypothetical protein